MWSSRVKLFEVWTSQFDFVAYFIIILLIITTMANPRKKKFTLSHTHNLFIVLKITHQMTHPQAPPSSLMDSTSSPKAKTTEGEKVGHALWLTTLWGIRACWSSGMGLARLISNSITDTHLQKPNNKLVSA
jgi:hypothetical protein